VPAAGFIPQLTKDFVRWWREQARKLGPFGAVRLLVRELWEFLRDSMPEQRRRRFGDMEFDWEHRVNTTSGTVGWRERLLGVFLSGYQPTEPAAFRQMMASLPIDFAGFTFIDLGSGKGRTLLMASEYSFRRIVGVEILPELHRIAEQNIHDYSGARRCADVRSVCADACQFTFPEDPLVLYLFNPLSASGLASVLRNLEESLRQVPRPALLLYYNPVLEQHLRDCAFLELVQRGEHFAVFAHRPSASLNERMAVSI